MWAAGRCESAKKHVKGRCATANAPLYSTCGVAEGLESKVSRGSAGGSGGAGKGSTSTRGATTCTATSSLARGVSAPAASASDNKSVGSRGGKPEAASASVSVAVANDALMFSLVRAASMSAATSEPAGTVTFTKEPPLASLLTKKVCRVRGATTCTSSLARGVSAPAASASDNKSVGSRGDEPEVAEIGASVTLSGDASMRSLIRADSMSVATLEPSGTVTSA